MGDDTDIDIACSVISLERGDDVYFLSSWKVHPFMQCVWTPRLVNSYAFTDIKELQVIARLIDFYHTDSPNRKLPDRVSMSIVEIPVELLISLSAHKY